MSTDVQVKTEVPDEDATKKSDSKPEASVTVKKEIVEQNADPFYIAVPVAGKQCYW